MQKMKKSALALAIAAATVAGPTMAAVDASFQPAVDGIVADVTAYIGIAAGAALGLMAIVLGWDTGISLVKKFIKRGSR